MERGLLYLIGSEAYWMTLLSKWQLYKRWVLPCGFLPAKVEVDGLFVRTALCLGG